MHSYVDFITHIKGVEYILSVTTIVGFIIFLEVLKPKPFLTLIRSGREDIDHIRRMGVRGTMKTVGRILVAPFIGLGYVVILPFVLGYALVTELLGMAAEGFDRLLGLAGKTAFFGWRPTEAYLGGRKKRKERKERKERKKGKGEETEGEREQ